MNEPSPIKILTTGGTIDKIYSLAGELEIGDPAVAEILELVRPTVAVSVDSVLRKDSLELTDQDRQKLCDHLEAVEQQHIVITHGTDTMTITAEYLQQYGRNLDGKVVVFTGAMQPASLKVTDSHFNVGVAIAAVQCMQPGIYVAMSGRVFPVGSVVKDRARGQFVSA